jgi:hypothetical protein
VHQSWSLAAVHWQVIKMIAKACTKVPVVSVSRMNNHSWLFVNQQQAVIFINNIVGYSPNNMIFKGGCVSITRTIKSFYFVIRLYCGVYKNIPSVA